MSIDRRDTGEGYKGMLEQLAKALPALACLQ